MTDYSSSDLESDFLPYSEQNVNKLAATVAMNTPYHPYSDITPPLHPPSPDNNNYPPMPGGYHNGHSGGGGGGGGGGSSSSGGGSGNGGMHTPQLTPMDDVSPDFPHHHHLHHHHHQQINNNNSPHKLCAGCGEKIADRFLLHALDRYWHNSCLKCHCCGAMLADMGSSCYTRRGLILCKKDYSSMFGCSGTCSGCGQTIPPNELVAKAMTPINQQATNNLDSQKSSQSPNLFVFHLKCFSCTKCGAHLRPGDRYTMLAGSLVCEQDWHKIIKNTTTANGATPAVRKGKVGRPRRTKE